MRTRGRFAGLGLVHLLLLVTIAELAMNRLAVPALRPPGDLKPPLWHQLLDHFGLFFMYFASTLAIGVLGYVLWGLLTKRDSYPMPLRYVMFVSGIAFLALAVAGVSTNPGLEMSFLFDSSFTILLGALLIAQLTRRGDLGAKIGLLLLAIPLLIHYYTPFALRFLEGEEAVWGDLPLRIQEYGQWSVVFVALASPYCFAPRPFLNSAAKLAPLAVATFVGMIGAVILRQHYEVGMLLASRGLGVDIGPGAPTHHIALYLMALAAITWTLSACLTAHSPARRDIGVGVGLVVAGGYAFAWPLQYLVGMVGLFTIAESTKRVRGEERGEAEARNSGGFRAPPILDEVWQSYVGALVEALRNGADDDKASTVTIRGEQDRTTTHVVTSRHGVSIRLCVDREEGSIVAVDALIGEEPPGGAEPRWTLYARPERLLGIRGHAEPPATSAPGTKTGDQSFDLRFRVRDEGNLTDKLLDDELRARATALVDGWMAVWPGHGLRYRVHPGRGAPLDHPIPITELAFRGAGSPPSVDRLATLLDLLAVMASRAVSDEPSKLV